MTAPAAGWYPDPSGSGGTRWWNGATWTEHAAPAAPAPTWPSGSTPWTPQGTTGTAWTPQAVAAPPGGWRRHQFSLLVVGFAAVYLLLALTVHVAIFGFLPALMAARAVRAKEPLAGGAVVIAIGTVVLAVTGLAGLWRF